MVKFSIRLKWSGKKKIHISICMKNIWGSKCQFDELHALIEEVVTQPFHDHVALAWSHWLIIQADDQCLASLLDGDASRSLSCKTIFQVNLKAYWNGTDTSVGHGEIMMIPMSALKAAQTMFPMKSFAIFSEIAFLIS